jgi:hypothetical protein
LFHNEALQVLDVVVAGAIAEPPLATPPPAPVIGQCYIVGPGATGAWAGHAHKLAAFTSGGWRFVAPRAGMSVYVESVSTTACYRGGAWELGTVRGSQVIIGGQKVVGSREPAIGAPVAGATIDAEARAAIGQILAALRQHGLIEM